MTLKLKVRVFVDVVSCQCWCCIGCCIGCAVAARQGAKGDVSGRGSSLGMSVDTFFLAFCRQLVLFFVGCDLRSVNVHLLVLERYAEEWPCLTIFSVLIGQSQRWKCASWGCHLVRSWTYWYLPPGLPWKQFATAIFHTHVVQHAVFPLLWPLSSFSMHVKRRRINRTIQHNSVQTWLGQCDQINKCGQQFWVLELLVWSWISPVVYTPKLWTLLTLDVGGWQW